MKYKFSDLVDVPKLNKLMESLYRASGIPSGIIDVQGDIMVAVGWREICTEFHRKHPQTEQLCRQSDICVTTRDIISGDGYFWHKCPNGLIDAAAPVVIDGIHLATVYQGQFLFEEPDRVFFERQAELYGFDKEKYLAALAKVPIYTPEKLDSIMHFFIELAERLTDFGVARLKQLEQQARELRRTDEQLFRIFNNTPDVAIQTFDAAGNLTFWNNASERLYGFTQEEVIGQPLTKILLDEKQWASLRAILEEIDRSNSLYGPAEWQIRHKKGSEVTVYSTLFPIALSNGKREFICMDLDITERKLLASEIERLDRLNLVGELAASLAHEIRNPMTTVRGYLQMLLHKRGLLKHAGHLELMIEELDSANQIISEYLSLAKNKKIDRKELCLDQLIETILPLLSAEAVRQNKSINWSPGDTRNLWLDANEIRQLVINIVRNALDAVGAGGRIDISTAMDAGEIVLTVQDNGPGIPAEILDKIGTPFFTTKPSGTGLGLAVCFSIAARHNATMAIRSGGEGTSVAVRFLRLPLDEDGKKGGC